ncbi:phage tail protein [Serratia microhaemolytica]|uniref:phage tail protein n=1 Tax=Serratia microhaemolytica TaxID=2675110 RepID=UPI000FDE9404|nr:phage tail protein [Serratia microhaemolytica]
MTVKYYATLTDLGAAKLANAAALGEQLAITEMAIGDGGGKPTQPQPSQTALIGEVFRAPVNTLTIDPKNSNQIIAELVIPESVGGWWLREIGLFDQQGNLIAIANCPETYKPQLQEGSARVQAVRMLLLVNSTENITLKIDPAVVLASRHYVDQAITAHAQSRNHPDATLTAKGFVQLSNAIDSNDETKAATPKAVKTAIQDLISSKDPLVELAGGLLVKGVVVYPPAGSAEGGEINFHDKESERAAFLDIDANGDFRVVTYSSKQKNAAVALCVDRETREVKATQAFTAGGRVHSGGGKAWLEVDGNIYGTLWGGWLSNYLYNSNPVGVPLPWPKPYPPGGWLKCNGAAFDKTKYPLLADAYPSGVLPDLRGEFIRGWDDTRGVDRNRGLLSRQDDGIGIMTATNGMPVWSAFVSTQWTAPWPASDGINGLGIGGAWEGSMSVSRAGFKAAVETRPRNIAFNYIVRAV